MSPPPRPISISAASAISPIAGIDVSYQNADRTIYAYRLPTAAQFTYPLGDHTANRRNIGMLALQSHPYPAARLYA